MIQIVSMKDLPHKLIDGGQTLKKKVKLASYFSYTVILVSVRSTFMTLQVWIKIHKGGYFKVPHVLDSLYALNFFMMLLHH